ncbi:TetR/AcrR family transcriptional regulator [Lysobacter enzymogenes]|uniref:TetR/AcrR family transcriptional regulator n=1 Tax=Lysobacter enzymogenes TaxID=69 RepID=UPI0008985A34|nr:TetR/AcrR family transcriptional regulator [Lysobacter enzymogenes]SDX59304.1 DNA-binding transcriptional regulator, AcrR family [Lysobacter enzymogenes]
MTSKTAPPPSARERILQTAHDLFYLEGVRATGVDRVIAESGVTKVTLYRHYPSKNDLILAFLDYRHERWMAWFDAALRRHGDDAAALAPALHEWFAHPQFRGCAFINTVAELGPALPAAGERARAHKRAMQARIAALLPAGAAREASARALAVAVDGAIVRAACDGAADDALDALRATVAALTAKKSR